ncbi:MAG: hypothetical protein HGB20_08950 [Chlorobiaceae bacterium]|nr:hypothetical protein [Chlorobiaceae bacterium]
MKIPEEIAGLLRLNSSRKAAAYLATAGLQGNPNLLAAPLTDVHQDEFVLLPDLFAQKTKVNLNENLRGAISLELPEDEGGWVLEGPCNIFQWGHPDAFRWKGLTAGEVLGRWGNWAGLEDLEALPDGLRPVVVAQRGVIALQVETVKKIGGK